MATERGNERPLLNAVLSLKREPAPTTVQGGSAGEKGIRSERLDTQRQALSASLRAASESAHLKSHAGKIHLVAAMFADSFAPTWQPVGLFSSDINAQFVSPASSGYLVEIESDHLLRVAERIDVADTVEARTAISRVQSIHPFGSLNDVFRRYDAKEAWTRASDGTDGRMFTIWLPPFKDPASRASVIKSIDAFVLARTLNAAFPSVLLTRGNGEGDESLSIATDQASSSVAQAARQYRNSRFTCFIAELSSEKDLLKLAGSGAVYRIDPLSPLSRAEFRVGPDPVRPTVSEGAHPIVGVVDGGLNATSYLPMEAWRAPSLVSDTSADRNHGNRISSLIAHGFAWNPGLKMPALECRIGTVQAIAKRGADDSSRSTFVSYLNEVIKSHASGCRVWNMSFNEQAEVDADVVSDLGHEIARIARRYGILPIISSGNVSTDTPVSIAPPADCEAALTVGGRMTSSSGLPGDPCPNCLKGPGPDGMWKPDLSSFSTVRAVGGKAATGSSFSAPSISVLAAHAFHNLKNPTPDLVRALLINGCDLDAHCVSRGWGTPPHDNLPWICPDGAVTLTWVARLRPGFAYYWEDIPIPPELIVNGLLHGSGALTAILNPLVSESGGPNYFATRLQVALQYSNGSGEVSNLLGSMKEDRETEATARAELAKWHPIRRHAQTFQGRSFRGQSMRLHARIFARDLYQFDYTDHSEIEPQEVAFVLTLKAAEAGSAIYNSMTQSLGTYVESAVIDHDINLENE